MHLRERYGVNVLAISHGALIRLVEHRIGTHQSAAAAAHHAVVDAIRQPARREASRRDVVDAEVGRIQLLRRYAGPADGALRCLE